MMKEVADTKQPPNRNVRDLFNLTGRVAIVTGRLHRARTSNCGRASGNGRQPGALRPQERALPASCGRLTATGSKSHRFRL